jgi:hypothetical protein
MRFIVLRKFISTATSWKTDLTGSVARYLKIQWSRARAAFFLSLSLIKFPDFKSRSINFTGKGPAPWPPRTSRVAVMRLSDTTKFEDACENPSEAGLASP